MKPEIEKFSFNAEEIVRCRLPESTDVNLSLLDSLERERSNFTHSHRINGRWENTYLPIEQVPMARVVITYARDLAVELFGKRLLALFKPVGDSCHPPFWFNLAEPGEITGVHNHASEALISGVYYVSTSSSCGDLFFRSEDQEDFILEPVVGTFVLFSSGLRHGVTENLSDSVRISLAFNIFEFPIPLSLQI